MKLTILLSILIITLCGFTVSQNTPLVCIYKTPTKATNVWLDKLNNYYLLTKTELIKYNTQNNTSQRYSNTSSSKPSSFDVSNPLRLMLSYNQFNINVWLDDMLAPSPDFKNSLTEQATLMCNSMLNGLWVYNQTELSLSRFDSKWNETIRVNNINQALTNFEPTVMQESNGKLYMFDVNYGCVILNTFGGVDKKIPLPNCSNVKVYDDVLYYNRGGKQYEYNTILNEEFTLNLKHGICTDVALTKQKIAIITNDTLYIYQR
jgi:hypothetical protein